MHHDDALGRLTDGSGTLLDKTAAALRAVTFKDTAERMMSLGDLCALVDGRVPLMIEVKSHFDGDRRLVARMARGAGRLFGTGGGDVVRPATSWWHCARTCPDRPRGIVAQATTMTPTGTS